MAPPRKAVAVVQGHRRPAVASLASSVTAPEPPKGLLASSRSVWAAFWRSDVARTVDVDADGPAITRWITYVDEWTRAFRAFRRQRIAEGSMGQPRLHPLAGYLAQLEQSIARAEQEFGMTPLARMKLGIATGEAALTAQRLNELAQGAGPVVDDEFAGEFEAAR